MKYLQIHIKAETGDIIGKFLKDIADKLDVKGIDFEIVYKDGEVEKLVKSFMAESMGHEKYFLIEDDNKL